MGVLLLLALAWVAVLVPPAVRAHAARQEAFLVSFGEVGPQPAAPVAPPTRRRSAAVQRRRHIAGGLLAAMAATLLAGLLPTFRVLLVVHLFLVDSFLAYIALLAHAAQRAAKAHAAPRAANAAPAAPRAANAPAAEPAPGPVARRRRLPRSTRPPALPDLAPAPLV